MLLERYRHVLGKSTHRQSLYDHSMAVVDVVLRIAALVGESPGPRLDQLVFGAVVHDVGKLDPDFQVMIEAAASQRPLPTKKVKHEACTFDHDHIRLVEDSKATICAELRDGIVLNNRRFTYDLNVKSLDERAMQHVYTFAVTHHGLFYVSYEQEGEVVHPRVRRQWTCAYPKEVRRMTFVDLLVEYYPLGGLVMMGDLIASYCHEQGKEYSAIFGRVGSIGELIAQLTCYAPEIEASIQQYDPRDYGIAALLKLLAGGIV